MSPVYSGKRINDKLPEIVVFLIMWHTKATILRALQVALGVLATFFSLLTTTLISVDNSNSKLFAFIAAISVALLAAFDLGTKSNNVTNAWRNLNSVIMQYNNGLCRDDVIKAYREGEQLIGNVSYQSTK